MRGKGRGGGVIYHNSLRRGEVKRAISVLLDFVGLAVVGVGPPTGQQGAAGGEADAVHAAVARLHECLECKKRETVRK